MVDTVRALLESIEARAPTRRRRSTSTRSSQALRGVLEGTPAEPAVAAPEPADPEHASAEPAVVAPAPEVRAPEVDAASEAAPDAASDAASDAAPDAGLETGLEAPVTADPAPVEAAAADAAVDATSDSSTGAEQDDESGRRGVVDSTVRVDVDLLDSLVQLVGELVLTRNQVLQRTEDQADVELVRAAQRLDLVTSELQEGVMKTRMQPIGQVWSKMPRIVRDLAHQLGREVDLRMEGHETELDRSLLEALRGPLTHLVRNAMDHGLERPDGPPRRRQAGDRADCRCGPSTRAARSSSRSPTTVPASTPCGSARSPSSAASITRDDAARMETRDVINLIFRPGFSTATEVTNVSGRGVGMDVVRTNIERIGGSVDLQQPRSGHGTTCRVRIPLTLAIIPALLVGRGPRALRDPAGQPGRAGPARGRRPGAQRGDTRRRTGAAAARPAAAAASRSPRSLGSEPGAGEALTVVVLQADDLHFGLCVSEIHDTQEIVVKPIGQQFKGLDLYAGATIMGDGRVALILDVAGLAQSASLEQTAAQDG